MGDRDFASLDRENLGCVILLHKKQANIPSLNLSLLSCRDKSLPIGYSAFREASEVRGADFSFELSPVVGYGRVVYPC
jgi:hypothetical protein